MSPKTEADPEIAAIKHKFDRCWNDNIKTKKFDDIS